MTVLLAFLFICAPVHAFDGRLTAVPSSNEITVDENVSVEFKVEVQGMAVQIGQPQYSAPDFDEINAYTGGKGFSSSFINGQITVSQSQTAVAVLRPKHQGRLVIRNIRARANNIELTAADIAIDVRPAGTQLGGGHSGGIGSPPPDKMPPGTIRPTQSGNGPSFFIRTEPSKLKVYKGEQIILTYALYTRVPLTMNPQVERYPNPNGFLKEDIDIPLLRGRLDYTPSVVNGHEYRRAVLAQYAIFPLKDGTLSVDTFTAKIAFQPGRTGNPLEDDPFAMLNNFFRAMQTTTETRTSDRVSVEVEPLPGAGQPANFTGLVGDFDISATADKNTVKTGDPINVKVKVSGSGHAGMLEHLNVAWPQDFELYEDKSNTQYARGQSERVFEYMVIPKTKGHFEIPAIELSMFNPESKTYVVRKSQPIGLDVLEGAAGTVYVPKAGTGATAAQVEDIHYWKDTVAESHLGLLTNAARGFALLSLAVALLGVWSLGVSPDVEKRLSQQRTAQALSGRIKALKGADGAPVETLGSVESLLGQLLELRYGVTMGSLTRSEVARALLEQRIEESIAKKVEALMELVENQRYAPGGGDKASAARAVEELMRLADRII